MMLGHSRIWMLPIVAIAAVLLGYPLWQGSVRAAAELGTEAVLKEAGAACQIASELKQSRVLWSSASFERNAALIVAGQASKTEKGAEEGEQAYMLCLFNKQDAKVELQPIEGTLFK